MDQERGLHHLVTLFDSNVLHSAAHRPVDVVPAIFTACASHLCRTGDVLIASARLSKFASAEAASVASFKDGSLCYANSR